jgi:hypothetical protein
LRFSKCSHNLFYSEIQRGVIPNSHEKLIPVRITVSIQYVMERLNATELSSLSVCVLGSVLSIHYDASLRNFQSKTVPATIMIMPT